MSQPIFWASLAVGAVVGVGLRLIARGPLWARRSSALPFRELVLAGVMLALLVFHCAAMFFPVWVDAVPLLHAPAESVRELGPVSQVAYWIPALGTVIALHRVWPPALGLLVLSLVGVGLTMFMPYSLTTHLAWIAAAVASLVVISSALVKLGSRTAQPS